jgi:N-acetyl-beta-hexosaminidase
MASDNTPMIPRPKVYRASAGHFQLDTVVTIAAKSPAARAEAGKLADWMRVTLGLNPRIADSAQTNVIALELVESLPGVPRKDPDEGYTIDVSPERVRLAARSDRGLFYAIQSLRDLVRAGRGIRIPACPIEDWPDFPRRGLLLAPGQAFTSIDYLKYRIDQMAHAKLNFLHIHATDAYIFNFKLASYPELAGSAADPKLCYTKAQLRDLVSYAADRKIEIVPELSMPGHATRIVEALPQLQCKAAKPSHWTMCLGSDETYKFIERVVAELAPIFKSPLFHIGTDEVEFQDVPDCEVRLSWRECPVCQARIKQEGLKDERDLFYYFIRRVDGILKSHGKRLMMWNDQIDIGKPADVNVPMDMLLHFWRIASPGRGPVDGCTYEGFLDKGFEVYNSYYPETYIDFHIDEQRLLAWNPYSSPACSEEHKKQVVGGQMCAWENHDLYRRVLPAAISLFADRVWNERPVTDKAAFARALPRHIFGPYTPDGLTGLHEALGSIILPLGLTPDLKAHADLSLSGLSREQKIEVYDRLLAVIDREAKSGRLEDPIALSAYRESLEGLRDGERK